MKDGEIVEARLIDRPVERRHVFGVRCHVTAVDHDAGTATFQPDGFGEAIVIPLFGKETNCVAQIGLQVGGEVWIECTAIVPIVSQETN